MIQMIQANAVSGGTIQLQCGWPTIEAAETQSKPAMFEAIGYSGGLMNASPFGDTVLDLSGLELTSQLPILTDHRSDLEGLVGTGDATIERNQLVVRGHLSRTGQAASRIIDLSREGIRLQASIGAQPLEWRQVRQGETVNVNGRTIEAGPNGFTLVTKSRLRELSLLPLGADHLTNVSIAANGSDSLVTPAGQTPHSMVHSAAHESGNGFDVQALRAEQLRIQRIVAICAEDSGLATQAIQSGISPEAVQQLIKVRDSRAEIHPDRGTRYHVQGSRQMPEASSDRHGDKGLECALLMRAGFESRIDGEYSPRSLETGHRLRSRSLVDLCEFALRSDGRQIPSNRNELIRAGFSTMSLPNALGSAIDRVLMTVYRDARSTWRSFAAIKSAANFKPQKGIQPGAVGNLQKIGPTGDIKHTKIDENVYTWQVDTFARTLRVSRQDIVNDDLDFLAELAPSMGRAAARSLSDLVWEFILANEGGHHSVGNANYQEGAGTALSMTSLQTALTALATRRDADGNDLDLMAEVITVSPELETTAREILESLELARDVSGADRQPTGNALRNRLKLDIEQRLSNSSKFSGASETVWFLWASPIDTPVIVGFLEGQQTPTVEFFGLDSNPDNLGVQWRVYHDYGVAWGDPKASYRSKGAA